MGDLGRDALVVGAPGDLVESAAVDFVDDGAVQFGLVEQGVKAGIVAQTGADPDSVQGPLTFEDGKNGVTPVDQVRDSPSAFLD